MKTRVSSKKFILSIFVLIFSWSSHLSWSKFSTSPTPFGLCLRKKQSKWYQLVILPSNFADWWNREDHQHSISVKPHLNFKIPGKPLQAAARLAEYSLYIPCNSIGRFSHIRWGKEDIRGVPRSPSCQSTTISIYLLGLLKTLALDILLNCRCGRTVFSVLRRGWAKNIWRHWTIILTALPVCFNLTEILQRPCQKLESIES